MIPRRIYQPPRHEEKTNCFAHQKREIDGKYICISMNEMVCKTQECKFYKPKESVELCREIRSAMKTLL